MIEVYPHAALVQMFGLNKIIKYKKGAVDAKRRGLRELQARILELLRAEPRLLSTPYLQKFLRRDVSHVSGRILKEFEDSADALVCAYMAFYYWAWAPNRTHVFGDIETGYIVNPDQQLTFTA